MIVDEQKSLFRIAILDDEQMWCDLIRERLQSDANVAVVATVMTQKDAVRVACKDKPDIFLVDLNLKSKTYSGISATKAILEASSLTQVFILTSSENEEDVQSAVSVGAVKYILKNNLQMLSSEIEHFLHKGFNPDRIIANNFARLRREQLVSCLTREEHAIVIARKEGVTRSKMALHLCKSESTIKTQIRSILIKIQADNLDDALLKIENCGVMPKKMNQ